MNVHITFTSFRLNRTSKTLKRHYLYHMGVDMGVKWLLTLDDFSMTFHNFRKLAQNLRSSALVSSYEGRTTTTV